MRFDDPTVLDTLPVTVNSDGMIAEGYDYDNDINHILALNEGDLFDGTIIDNNANDAWSALNDTLALGGNSDSILTGFGVDENSAIVYGEDGITLEGVTLERTALFGSRGGNLSVVRGSDTNPADGYQIVIDADGVRFADGGLDDTVPNTINAQLALSDETTSRGCFVVDGLSVDDTDMFYDATFSTSTIGTNIVVGSVTQSHVYAARSLAGGQKIAVDGDDWRVTATDNKDTITNSGSGATLRSGKGNDVIENSGASTSIDGGSGNDSIANEAANVTISGGSGRDSITNSGDGVMIEGGSGNDYISNSGTQTSIRSGEGNDTILPGGNGSTVTVLDYAAEDRIAFEQTIAAHSLQTIASEGNLTLTSDAITLILENTALEDIINTTVNNAGTVNTIEDLLFSIPVFESINASITLSNETTVNGYFVVDGLSVDDTDTFNAATFTASTVETDNIVGRVTQSHVYTARSDFGIQKIAVEGDDWRVTATDGDDTLTNSGTGATLRGGKGNDVIENSGASTSISGGSGRDYITNSGDGATIEGGSGNDLIRNQSGARISINAGDGNDSIYGTYYGSTILGGAGNDSIMTDGSSVTIRGGAGNDTLGGSNSYKTFLYSSGDGNDVITNFGTGDALAIADGEVSSVYISSDDWIIEVTSGSDSDTVVGLITLKDTADMIFQLDGNTLGVDPHGDYELASYS